MFHQEQIALTSTALLLALKSLVSGTPPIFMLSCETLQRIYHGRGLVIIFSDLFGDRDALSKGLQVLRQRGHDVAICHILDDDEIDFPFDGPDPL
jgi:hypothetical protein